MRIVHVINNYKFGGGESVIFNILDCLQNEYEFYYLCRENPDKKIIKKLERLRIPLFTFSSKAEMISIIKKVQPDVIHSHSFRTTIYLALRNVKYPVVAHIHNYYEYLNQICARSLLFYLSCLRIDYLIACQDRILKESIVRKIVKKKSELIQNTVNKQEVIRQSNSFDLTWKPDVVFVGVLTDRKDPIRFLSILSEIREQQDNVQAAIIGSGELAKQCEEFVEKNGLGNNVRLLGQLDNPYPYIKSAKILIMTSKSEGLPMVALESVALSTWVLCTQNCGLEKVVNQNNGVICNSDEEFITNSIRILNENKRPDGKVEPISAYSAKIKRIYELVGNKEK